MQKYELLYIIPAKFTEDEVKGLSDKVGKIVSANGGAELKTMVLGRRKLAYPIDHVRNGYYVMTDFSAEEVATSKIEQALRLSTDVLRHLIIKKDPMLTKIPEFAPDGDILKKEGEEDRRGPKAAAPRERRPAPVREKDKLTAVQLDEKIDEMLTEEVQ
jgi:small subunit ribosomal protein S6